MTPKQTENTKKNIEAIQRKLANPKFTTGCPADILQQQRELLAKLQKQLAEEKQ